MTSPVGTSTNAAPTIAWRPTGGTNRLIVTNTATNATVIDVDGVTGLSYTPPSGLPAGSYQARIEVNGVPAAGGASTFQIEAVTSGAHLTRALDYETNPVPTFGWTAVANATRYDLWVDDVTKGVSRLLYTNTLTGTAYQATRALPPGVYRAWIRAYNGFSPIGSWSTPVTFRVTAASSVPTIWAPINNTVNTLPTIAWSSVTSATSYTVTLRQNGTVVEQASTSNNWLTVRDVLATGTYEVEVVAVGVNGLNSDASQFTVGTTSGTTQVLGLSGTITNTRPTFTWPITDSANRYVIWVNDDTRNIVATVFESELKTTVFTPSEALLPGNHRVWVRAFNGSTALTPWSPAAPFTIAETAAPPVITAPAATTTNPVPPITWTAASGATAYELEIVDTAASGQPVVYSAQRIAVTVHRPTQALAKGSYAARVLSIDSGGTPSAWSVDYFFEVTAIDSTEAASLVTPLFGSAIGGTNVLFAWTSPSAADARYDLWVSNLTDNSRPVFETSLTATSYLASNLPTGNYRAWVRVIGTNVNSAWSVGQEFAVTAIGSSATLPDVAGKDSRIVLVRLDLYDDPDIAVPPKMSGHSDGSPADDFAAAQPIVHFVPVSDSAEDHGSSRNPSNWPDDHQLLDAVLADVAEVLT